MNQVFLSETFEFLLKAGLPEAFLVYANEQIVNV